MFDEALSALTDGAPGTHGDKDAVLPPCDNEQIPAQLAKVAGLWSPSRAHLAVLIRAEPVDSTEIAVAGKSVLAENQTLPAEERNSSGIGEFYQDVRKSPHAAELSTGIAARR